MRSCHRLGPTPERRTADARTSSALAGADHVTSLVPDHSHADPVVSAADVIDQQPDRSAVIRHHDVGVAVVVDVAERGAAADLGIGSETAPAWR